jgi:hypothetical protein
LFTISNDAPPSCLLASALRRARAFLAASSGCDAAHRSRTATFAPSPPASPAPFPPSLGAAVAGWAEEAAPPMSKNDSVNGDEFYEYKKVTSK